MEMILGAIRGPSGAGDEDPGGDIASDGSASIPGLRRTPVQTWTNACTGSVFQKVQLSFNL
jgi:hypothetical protein